MTAVVRAFTAEIMKLKRTLALWMVLVAPASISFLNFVMYMQRTDLLTEYNRTVWLRLAQNIFIFWTALMLPLFIALETALIAGADHNGRHWKQLFAQPVPRWTLYLSKFLSGALVVALGSLLLIATLLMTGGLFRVLRPGIGFEMAFPWEIILRFAWRQYVACLLIVAIHTWVANRWDSFYLAVGVGIVAEVVNIVAINSETWNRIFPWILPATSTFGLTGSQDFAGAGILWLSALGGLIVLLLGSVDFVHRDVL
jgi:hypothetical protein